MKTEPESKKSEVVMRTYGEQPPGAPVRNVKSTKLSMSTHRITLVIPWHERRVVDLDDRHTVVIYVRELAFRRVRLTHILNITYTIRSVSQRVRMLLIQ